MLLGDVRRRHPDCRRLPPLRDSLLARAGVRSLGARTHSWARRGRSPPSIWGREPSAYAAYGSVARAYRSLSHTM